MNQFNLSYFLVGCLGGLLPDVLRVVKNMYSEKFEDYWKRFHFWLGLFFLVGLGGLAAWAAGAEDFIEALAYGFSAPELLSKIFAAKGKPEIEPTTLRRIEERFGGLSLDSTKPGRKPASTQIEMSQDIFKELNKVKSEGFKIQNWWSS